MSNSSSVMDGYKSHISNAMNVFDFLFGIPSNHVITSCVFFQWLYFVLSFTTFTIFSNNCLLILPISGLQGFISRHVGLFLKFSLWSLRVIKDHLYIPADKTNNYYRVKPADYEQLLEKSVRKNYKKTDRAAINDIIKTDIHIAKNLDLADRINTTAERESFSHSLDDVNKIAMNCLPTSNNISILNKETHWICTLKTS